MVSSITNKDKRLENELRQGIIFWNKQRIHIQLYSIQSKSHLYHIGEYNSNGKNVGNWDICYKYQYYGFKIKGFKNHQCYQSPFSDVGSYNFDDGTIGSQKVGKQVSKSKNFNFFSIFQLVLIHFIRVKIILMVKKLVCGLYIMMEIRCKNQEQLSIIEGSFQQNGKQVGYGVSFVNIHSHICYGKFQRSKIFIKLTGNYNYNHDGKIGKWIKLNDRFLNQNNINITSPVKKQFYNISRIKYYLPGFQLSLVALKKNLVNLTLLLLVLILLIRKAKPNNFYIDITLVQNQNIIKGVFFQLQSQMIIEQIFELNVLVWNHIFQSIINSFDTSGFI